MHDLKIAIQQIFFISTCYEWYLTPLFKVELTRNLSLLTTLQLARINLGC